MKFPRPLEYYHKWPYHNTMLLLVSLVVLWYFADSPLIKGIVQAMGSWGYAGAFLTGVFFVSVFTVAPALLVLYQLAEVLNPYEVAIFAGAGGVLGDYIIFYFLKDKVFEELTPIYHELGGSHLTKLFRTPYFAWLAPVVGAAIIASPLPDEVGISILGIAKLKNWQFLMLALALDTIGVLAIVLLASRG